ncbi:MAG: hypothetical protein QE493_03470 [Verrucomicrobiae bacterium]|nr:hypothetical protein [Verrucomicrobiae bacterium]
MDAALDSHFDLGSMYTYSPVSKCSPALPHQPSRPPRHDQYEISGLKRVHFLGASKPYIRTNLLFQFQNVYGKRKSHSTEVLFTFLG